MSIDSKVTAEFEALAALGAGIRERFSGVEEQGYRTSPQRTGYISEDDFEKLGEWCARSLTLVQRLDPANRAAASIELLMSDKRGFWSDFLQARGTLSGLRAQFENGLLIDLRAELRNEVHEDFLEQAESFVTETTPVPDSLKCAAAVLAGGVLEDGLREMASRKSVSISGHSGIAKLNAELYRSKLYSRTEMKQVELWGDYRNNAAHNKPGEVPADQLLPMIAGVRAFIGKYLV